LLQNNRKRFKNEIDKRGDELAQSPSEGDSSMSRDILVSDILDDVNIVSTLKNLTILTIRATNPENLEKYTYAVMVEYSHDQVGFHKPKLSDIQNCTVVGVLVMDKEMLTNQDSPIVTAINEQGYMVMNLGSKS
jgi:hypothetical protein